MLFQRSAKGVLGGQIALNIIYRTGFFFYIRAYNGQKCLKNTGMLFHLKKELF